MRIITRAEWGAAPPRSEIPRRSRTDWIILHHTAGPNDTLSPEQEAAYCRQMQASHFARGWADIGQHFTVMRSGRIYAGRPVDLVGAHTPRRNADSVGIEHQGTFLGGAQPSEEQIAASAELIGWLMARYGLTADRISYHRRWYPTACPGTLVDWIPEIARRAQAVQPIPRGDADMDSTVQTGREGSLPCYVGPVRPDYRRPDQTKTMWGWLNAVAGERAAKVRVWWTDAAGSLASATHVLEVPPRTKRGVDLFWLAGSKPADGVVWWASDQDVTVQIDRIIY